MMNTSDKKAWIEYNGIVNGKHYDGYISNYRVEWTPHYSSSIFLGYGDTTDDAIEDIYDVFEDKLFGECQQIEFNNEH